MHLRRLRVAAAVMLSTACGPSLPASGTESGTTSTADSTVTGQTPTTGSATASTVTSDLATTASTITATGDATSSTISSGSAGTTGDTGQSFIPTMDVPPPAPGWCDTYLQDCPPGQKCSVSYGVRPGSAWDHPCVPVVDNPAQLDKPCVAEVGDGWTGIDNCDIGLFCNEFDLEGNGQCAAFCTGAHRSPTCPDHHICGQIADSTFDLCYRYCDPLIQDCPNLADICIFQGEFEPGMGYGQTFCSIDTSGPAGQLHDMCHYTTECDAGLACLLTQAAKECKSGACCEPFCDITAPNTCPGDGQNCVAWFPPDDAPAGYENVGVCWVP